MADEHATLLTVDTIIWLKFQLLAQNVSHIYAITIITSSYYYWVAMKISDLQDSLITINGYSCGRMRVEDIGKLLFDPKIMILVG